MNENIYVYPTDTVWGIGCNIFSYESYLKIAKIKKTDSSKPLSIMFSDIDEFKSYFQFSKKLNSKELLRVMQEGLTLLLPIKKLNKVLDSYIYGNSDFISVRLLDCEHIKKMRDEIKAPFFTTSLNITGENPITEKFKAHEFKNQYCNDAIFIDSQDSNKLSGISSTIILVDENCHLKIIRAGKNDQKILNQLEFLNLF